jgi:hypothetical protein
MSGYTCPFNNRACRCDPKAEKRELRPCMLANRVSKFVRMFGSGEYEADNALRKLRQLSLAEGLDFNDLAIVIENCEGILEEKKFSGIEMQWSFGQGVEKGRAEEARKRPPHESTDYFDADGRPQNHAIAVYCQRHYQHLNDKTREFVDDMTGKTMWRALSPKQEKWLISIFRQLGSGTR